MYLFHVTTPLYHYSDSDRVRNVYGAVEDPKAPGGIRDEFQFNITKKVKTYGVYLKYASRLIMSSEGVCRRTTTAIHSPKNTWKRMQSKVSFTSTAYILVQYDYQRYRHPQIQYNYRAVSKYFIKSLQALQTQNVMHLSTQKCLFIGVPDGTTVKLLSTRNSTPDPLIIHTT